MVAPLFAWALLGEGVTLFTAAGGILIMAAGAVVVLFGGHEMEPEPPL